MTKPGEGVDIIIRDMELNPECQHGPTVLFSLKNGRKYFSCAGIRNKDCFYLDYESFNQEKVNEYSVATKDNTQKDELSFKELQTMSIDQRIYCKTCEVFIKSVTGHETHNFVRGISEKIFSEPSLFLSQLDNDKFNAQYFFDDSTLDFICSIFESLKLRKIICIGAPRLHDYIKNYKPDIQSILLDIDDRFRAFNRPECFIRYNIFNNHFFNGRNDERKLIEFLQDDHPNESQHCLFSDPPFAARTELLSFTFRKVASLFNRVNSHHKVLPMFLIFPYFNEHHIQKEMPEMQMLDFQVSYRNHRTFHDGFKGRKAGSPIRIFTNVDPSLIKFPSRFVNYRFCPACRRYVCINNNHCGICKTCPSKNGATYRHCQDCIMCVKPNYIHCKTCNRCVPKTNHDCADYQQHQECWFCKSRGHVEKNCDLMKKFRRRNDGTCVVCKGKKKHHLKLCPSKIKYLE